MTILEWAGALWRTAFFGVLGLAVVLVVDALLRRRWDLLRDLVVAALGVAGATVVQGQVVESDWLPLKAHLLARWGYPELRLAGATAVIVVVGPKLVRTARLVATWLSRSHRWAPLCLAPPALREPWQAWRSGSAQAPSLGSGSARQRAYPRPLRCATR
jgi:hypothetical protein